MSEEDSEEIKGFEDSEDPRVLCQDQEEQIGVELADEEEIEFLDGLSELASLQSGERPPQELYPTP